MARKFYVETFGCQMNELDSEKIAGRLRAQGMEAAEDPAEADVVIFNTCSVREKAVQKAYARLGAMKRRKRNDPRLLVGVVGCMAQLEGERILERAPFVDVVAGPQKSHRIVDLLKRAEAEHTTAVDLRMDEDPETLDADHILRESPWRAGVTISEGCSRRCSFCVVPQTRGRQRNREGEAIVREVEDLAAQGYVEVLLLGQTVNSWRDPARRELTFAGLLARLAGIEGLKRIRFTSPHPSDFTEELLDVMVDIPQVCNHIHLPVQSGSTKVLRAMRRGYTRERYLKTIDRIKSARRPIAISTDMIVGFPGETESDFQDTLSLLDAVQYDCVFSFKYSPRPNTEALSLHDDVAEEEKATRLKQLQDQQKLIQYNRNAAYVGRRVEILVDDRARSRFTLSGRTGDNKVVNFDGPDALLGRFVKVEITGFSANSLKGVWIQNDWREQ